MIPKAFIEDVISRANIADIVGQRMPDLKQKSANNYEACCPFHSESTASFTVSVEKNFYHCFGCGAHGNALNFIKEHDGLSFVEALKILAESVGMTIPADNEHKPQHDKQDAQRYMRASAILSESQGIYANHLTGSVEAKEYIFNKRGLEQRTIDKFGIGFAPNAWHTITGNRTFRKEPLIDAGLALQKENSNRLYDRFRNRVMFPIFGKGDTPIGYGGRSIDGQDPKYLNSPDCLVFHKGEHLYGLKQAAESIRTEKRCFVVEGYMDVVMLSQTGIENVVASLGTSITDCQIGKLFKLAKHITFCMDGDAAGRKAAWRAAENILPILDDGMRIDFMFMPDGVDPDDYVRNHGLDAFRLMADESCTLTDYILKELSAQSDMDNGESLASYLSRSNALASQVKNGVIKLSLQKGIAARAGISLDTMLDMLKERDSAKRPAQAAEITETAEVAEVINHPAPENTPKAPAKHTQDISVAAKMLGIAAIHTRQVSDNLDIDNLSRFLSVADKEMLFPLLAYLKANPTADSATIITSLSFNPHKNLITALVNSARLMGEDFDAVHEANETLARFASMERVWLRVIEDQRQLKVA